MVTGVILLAAGRSTRFGGDKRLAPLPGHQDPVLFTALKHIQNSGLPCFVVLHKGDKQLTKRLDQQGVAWGICPDASLGMGHSLAFGVRSTQHWQGWLIALADMPWIQANSYRAIATALDGHNIVRPVCIDAESQHHYGHPVAFSLPFAYQLMQCHGDTGARHLLKQSNLVTELIINDSAICKDIDKPIDLDRHSQ